MGLASIGDWVFAKYLLPSASRRHERLVQERKRKLLKDIDGNVVELGPGTGPNFAYFPDSVRWTGVEPNPHLAVTLRGPERLVVASTVPIANSSADAVVCTLVLCSVSDPVAELREVVRILKPGGRFYFLEHIAADCKRRPGMRRTQRVLQPLWRFAAGNCHPCRDTLEFIRGTAGFADLEYEIFDLPLGPLSPHLAGVATKRP
jgi:SAM-dependent methyltransferase